MFRFCLYIISAWLIFASCGDSDRQEADIPSYIQQMGDVTIFPIPENADTLRLVKEMVFGDTDSHFFSSMGEFTVDSTGRVYIMEGAVGSKAIHIFNPDGTYIARMGREGEGPGEFSSPRSLKINDGELYLYDSELSRITTFSTESLQQSKTILIDPTRMIGPENIQGQVFDDFYFLNRNQLLLRFISRQIPESDEPGTLHYYIADESWQLISEEIFRQDQILETWGMNSAFGILLMNLFPFFNKPLIEVTESGRILSADSKDFLIHEHAPDGDTLASYFYYPYKAPDVSRDDALISSSSSLDSQIAEDVELPEKWPVLHSMYSDDQGRLWISTIGSSNEELNWWVLAESGDIIASFSWPGDRFGWPLRSSASMKLIKDGYFYAREENEVTGVDEVVRYRIEIGD